MLLTDAVAKHNVPFSQFLVAGAFQIMQYKILQLFLYFCLSSHDVWLLNEHSNVHR